MNNYKVSIIVPVYRCEKYLERCVCSILNQTYNNIECILVDDGSDDNSPKICDSFCNKDKRVRVLHQKNFGVSVARNAGLEAATGEIIGFVDSDDFIDETMIEELILPFLTDQRVDVSICNIRRMKDNSSKIYSFSYNFSDGVYPGKQLADLTLMPNEIDGFVFIKLFKKYIIDKERIRFDKDIKYMEDVLFSFQYLMHCNFGYVTSKNLYNYFVNENSVTMQKSLPEGTFSVFDKLKLFSVDNNQNRLIDYRYNCMIVNTYVKKRVQKEYEYPKDYPKEKLYKNLFLYFKNPYVRLIKKMYYFIIILFPWVYKLINEIRSK